MIILENNDNNFSSCFNFLSEFDYGLYVFSKTQRRFCSVSPAFCSKSLNVFFIKDKGALVAGSIERSVNDHNAEIEKTC